MVKPYIPYQQTQDSYVSMKLYCIIWDPHTKKMQQTGTIIQFVTGATEPSNQWTNYHTQAIVRVNDGRGSLIPYDIHHLQTYFTEEDQRIAFSKQPEHANFYDPKSLVECIEYACKQAKLKFEEDIQVDDEGDSAPGSVTIDMPDDVIPTSIDIEGCEYGVFEIGLDRRSVTYQRA